MKKKQGATYSELVDKLADKVAQYTRILKDQRNSDEHMNLRDEIHDLLLQIQVKREEDLKESQNDDDEKVEKING